MDNLSVADQCSWPRHWLWRLYQEPGVDSEGKDIVDIVDDATDESDAANNDEDQPEDPPACTLGQGYVMKSVSWGP